MSHQPDNICAGTQVVSLVHPRGVVGGLARVEAHRGRLLSVKHCEVPWPEVDASQKELHGDFEATKAVTKLPDGPDYEGANHFLEKAWRQMANLQTNSDKDVSKSNFCSAASQKNERK